jgi:hypothetical protein
MHRTLLATNGGRGASQQPHTKESSEYGVMYDWFFFLILFAKMSVLHSLIAKATACMDRQPDQCAAFGTSAFTNALTRLVAHDVTCLYQHAPSA